MIVIIYCIVIISIYTDATIKSLAASFIFSHVYIHT